MSIGDVVVIVLLVLLVGGAVYSLIKNKNKGCHCSGGNCSMCEKNGKSR